MKEESSVKQVAAPVERVYATLSNLENLRPLIERMQNDESIRQRLREAGHEDAIENLKALEITPDSLSIPASMLGTVSLKVVEREENRCIKFQTAESPVAAKMWIQVLPVTDATSKMRLTIDADIPFMLRAMVGSKMKEGVEMLATALASIPY